MKHASSCKYLQLAVCRVYASRSSNWKHLTLNYVNRRHSEWIAKYDVDLKTFQQEGLSEPEFHDLVYKFRRIVGNTNISEQSENLVNCYKKLDFNIKLCGKLYAWLLIQLWLITLFPFQIAWRWIGPQTERQSLPQSISGHHKNIPI